VKLNQQNIFVRFILRTIDVIVTLWLYQGIGVSRRWDEEPFKKADKSEWRHGCFFVAILPVALVTFMRTLELIPNTFYNSGYATVLLWAGFVILVSIAVFVSIKITPKIHLSVSIPIAVITWPVCLWYAVNHWVLK